MTASVNVIVFDTADTATDTDTDTADTTDTNTDQVLASRVVAAAIAVVVVDDDDGMNVERFLVCSCFG